MSGQVILSVLLALCLLQQQAQGIYWTNLHFGKGDVIWCRMNVAAAHVLLATSSSDVAHMVGDKSSGNGLLQEESWTSYHHREGTAQTNCFVESRAESPNLAVDKAREDISKFSGQRIYYNLWTCNCEHWVTKWVTGVAFSGQVISRASSSCDAKSSPYTDSDYARYGVVAKTTNGGRCWGDCTQKESNGKYYCKLSEDGPREHHCSPRRGTTYRGANCAGECQRYIDYYFCYTDNSGSWDYCGPSL